MHFAMRNNSARTPRRKRQMQQKIWSDTSWSHKVHRQ
jgi:hypothetical protein